MTDLTNLDHVCKETKLRMKVRQQDKQGRDEEFN
jgi:hypothetical protein